MPGEAGVEDGQEAAAIQAAASCVGLTLAPSAALAMSVHARLVREAGATLNLTRILQPADMLVRHILDSLVPIAIWPEAVCTAGPALDLGSGAGYPGVVLAAAAAARDVQLVEATGKKAAFLARVVDTTGVPARAVWARAEAPAGRVDAVERVWVRAVGPLSMLVEVGFGLLVPGGVLVAWKGPDAVGGEADEAETACRILGGESLGVRRYELAAGAGQRTLFAYRRGTRAMPRGLPRPPAVIRRRPLGRP